MPNPSPQLPIDCFVFPAAARLLGAALTAIAAANLPLVLFAIVRGNDDFPLLLRSMFYFSLLPALGARLVLARSTATIDSDGDRLLLRRRRWRIEVPAASIVDVRPWRLPLPAAGFSLILGSGRKLDYGIACADPGALLLSLSERCKLASAADAASHPVLEWGHARSEAGVWRWYHLLAKFGLFGLVPALIAFNADQHISYGGTFGQYYVYGLRPYLTSLAFYCCLTEIYLVAYAGTLRLAGEAVALAAAWIVPSVSTMVRAAVEWMCRILYYGGVAAMLALRFLD